MKKFTNFTYIKKKTPFQKHKEAEEAKRKQDELANSKLYEEFVDSFKAEEEKNGGMKAFVRGEIVEPGTRPSDAKIGASKGKKYVPSFMPPGMEEALSNKKSSRDEPKHTQSSKGKTRAIDMVLEEMKRDQQERDERRARGEDPSRDEGDRGGRGGGGMDDGFGPGGPGGFDNDPHTTNLYVGNLSPDVDEDLLKREFVRFGPIASVKIMWPRTEEERSRGRNCGFVAFMDRQAAAEAKDEMNNTLLNGFELHLGWGKGIAVPAQPIWPPPGGIPPAAAATGFSPAGVVGAAVPPPGAALSSSSSSSLHPAAAAATLPGLMQGTANVLAAASQMGLAAPSATPVIDQHLLQLQSLPPSGNEIHVRVPVESSLRWVIDCVAKYVLQDGCPFEQHIMERERNDPLFSFLFLPATPEHQYYRWRLYSLANGDTLQQWRTSSFMMVAGGALWYPPPCQPPGTGEKAHQAQLTPQGSGGGVAGTVQLSDAEADEFEEMLRGITMERAEIRRVMGFCLEHTQAALDVVETIVESLTLSETPIPTKVARLYLVSDILHNSSCTSVKGASLYRTHLEPRLPEVFESLQETFRLEGVGRITQEALKRRVQAVLRAWGDWFLFPEAYLTGLQATFLRGGPSGRDQSALEAELEALSSDDLDRRCRRSGISNKNGRSASISRLLALDDYLLTEKESKEAPPVLAPLAGGGQLNSQPLSPDHRPRRGIPLRPEGESGGEEEEAAVMRDEEGKRNEDVESLAPHQPQDMFPSPAPQPQPEMGVVEAKEGALASLAGLAGLGGYESSDSEDGEGKNKVDAPSSRDKTTKSNTQSPKVSKVEEPKSRWNTEEDEDEDNDDDKHKDKKETSEPSSAGKSISRGPSTKWDDDDDEDEETTMSPQRKRSESGLEDEEARTPSGGGLGADDASRERRRMLEVAVMKLRQVLEEEGRSKEEIEEKVQEFRKRQESKDKDSKERDKERSKSKSSSKDKDKDREKEKEREKDKEREREKEKSKHRKRDRSRSRSRERSSGKSSSRDKDRDRDYKRR